MSDTDRTDGLPSTIPPPPESPGEQAALASFLRLDGKLDKVLEMLGRLTLLAEDVLGGQEELRTRVSALEAIQPHRATIAPPAPNGHDPDA